MNKKFFKYSSRGFTLMELLIVIAIIGVLVAIVVVALNDARDRGANAGIKSNLDTARSQAEVFYNVNTDNPNSYINVCTNGVVPGGVDGIGFAVSAASRAAGLSGAYGINVSGALNTATCKGGGNYWVAEVPLFNDGNAMWCVDSTGRSQRNIGTIGASTTCE